MAKEKHFNAEEYQDLKQELVDAWDHLHCGRNGDALKSLRMVMSMVGFEQGEVVKLIR